MVCLLTQTQAAGQPPGFRLTIENMTHDSTAHEVLAVVLQVRPTHGKQQLRVLLWQRAQQPETGHWSLPGGRLGPDEDVEDSARRQLAEKVDVREVAHLEQLAVFSDPQRVPHHRTVASTFLGLVPLPADPQLPADTAWHPVNALPAMSFDHQTVLQRVLTRRGVLSPTGGTTVSGRSGGRPAGHYRFTEKSLRVTDAFAALRPPPSESTPTEPDSSPCEPQCSDVP